MIGEPAITLEEVREELCINVVQFSTDDEFKLIYTLYGSEKDMSGQVFGKYGVGMLSYMIEYIGDDDE